MDTSRPPRRPTAIGERDAPTRHAPPPKAPPGKILILSALAVLLVVTLVGTTALVIRDLRNQAPQTASEPTQPAPTQTAQNTTPTPDLRNPANNGWTSVAPAKFADTQFAPSNAQRGYLCGAAADGSGRVFGVTTDGGQSWKVGPSPATYPSCALQLSPTNSLDVALVGDSGPGAGSASVDAHYSADGGKTWMRAPLPQNAIFPAGALWSGAYLYAWTGPNKENGQQGSLQVSASGGTFTAIDTGTLLPGAQNVNIWNAVAGGSQVYLNLAYNGCSSQNCMAVVASSDGGKTWSRIPSAPGFLLVSVMGSTLYGELTQAQPPTEVRSSDNGASWTTLTFPALPDGQPVAYCQPLPAGSCFTSNAAGAAYLRGGRWMVIPFSSSKEESVAATAVSLGTDGQPLRVWGHNDGAYAGVYWHALP